MPGLNLPYHEIVLCATARTNRKCINGYSLRGFHFMDFRFASIRKLNSTSLDFFDKEIMLIRRF